MPLGVGVLEPGQPLLHLGEAEAELGSDPEAGRAAALAAQLVDEDDTADEAADGDTDEGR